MNFIIRIRVFLDQIFLLKDKILFKYSFIIIYLEELAISSLTESFIKNNFAEYYKQNSSTIIPPISLESREFGFLLLEKKIMVRHKSFKDITSLRESIINIVPSDVYYSSAYYELPEEPMKSKGWIGADLVFDIDSDHIPTPCAKSHDLWVCNSCGTSGKGKPPAHCLSCKGTKFKEKPWPCEVCLEASKVEAIKLIDILRDDFGFSSEMLTVAFSGHRGYHIHVESDSIRDLNSMARKEIVDYVMGTGLNPKFHGLGEKTLERRISGPNLDDGGWRGRIAKGTFEFLLDSSKEKLSKAGLKPLHIRLLLENIDAIVKSWNKRGPWGTVKGITPATWNLIAQYALKNQSVKIDTVVTPDINRLIRLKNTLHGKTGLKKIELSITNIDDFDPLKSAIAFSDGEVTLYVSDVPQFRVNDENYGPFKKQKVEIPTAAALMLLCKGVAKVVN